VPRARSKKQQAFFWGVLVPQGKMTKAEAKKRSARGKTYRKLPTRVRKRTRR
jgi:hypothetical protein